MSERTRNIVIGVVTTVWTINFTASVIPAFAYDADQAINGIFMAIVGGLIAYGGKKNDPPPSSGPPAAPKEDQ